MLEAILRLQILVRSQPRSLCAVIKIEPANQSHSRRFTNQLEKVVWKNLSDNGFCLAKQCWRKFQTLMKRSADRKACPKPRTWDVNGSSTEIQHGRQMIAPSKSLRMDTWPDKTDRVCRLHLPICHGGA